MRDFRMAVARECRWSVGDGKASVNCHRDDCERVSNMHIMMRDTSHINARQYNGYDTELLESVFET